MDQTDATTNGVLYICTLPSFTAAGVESARSVRKHSPDLLIDIYTDSPEVLPDGLFDRVNPISDPHRRSKVDYMNKTRFQRTLYLDTDTRVVSDILEMFELLDRFDMALAHAHARNRKFVSETWRNAIPCSFPQLNSGVMLYRRTPEVQQLLSDWQQAYHSAGFKKDQTTLRELLWLSDLRLHVLPPEYNIRYPKYLKVWAEKEAVPRIQHFATYHSDIEAEGGKRKNLVSQIAGLIRGRRS